MNKINKDNVIKKAYDKTKASINILLSQKRMLRSAMTENKNQNDLIPDSQLQESSVEPTVYKLY